MELNDFKDEVGKIIGPPGTGKTTFVLDLIGKAAKKYDPEKIGAVSYTKAAVNEMRKRVAKAHDGKLPYRTVKNIRTIHSHCFHLLGLTRDKVADEKIEEWNDAYPNWELPVANLEISEDEHYAPASSRYQKEHNILAFNEIQVRRNRMEPEKYWSDVARYMWKDWKHWMFVNDYMDYTGMLEMAYQRQACPNIDILFVDEAQDLTKLQLEIMKLWIPKVNYAMFVGDSDQAIFKFAGADPGVFINLANNWERVLSKSFRVPKEPYILSRRIIALADDREDSDFQPTDEKGKVIWDIRTPDLSLEGTHMIIGRCNYHMKRWKEWLIDNGEIWHNPYRPGDKAWNPADTKLWRASKAYVNLKRGEVISYEDLKDLVQCTMAKGNLMKGVKTGFDEMTEKFSDKEIDMFSLMFMNIFTDEFLSLKKPIKEVVAFKGRSGEVLQQIKNEEDILRGPRVTLGTIHSVKGGEADHVWIDQGTSIKALMAMDDDPRNFYDEARVAYVAVTRARKTVGLLLARGYENRVFTSL